MSRIIYALLLVYLSSSSLFGQLISGQFEHDSVMREYTLFIPQGYQPGMQLPLVFNLHGYTSNGISQRLYSRFNDIADTANVFVVYPEGLVGDVPAGPGTHWNAHYGTGVDDIGFLSKLIDRIYTDYDIDLTRVYSTGMSNGGFMSYMLACELEDRIAAIGHVAGAMTFPAQINCTPDRPVPILHIHGDIDTIVPYNGSAFFHDSITVFIDQWIGINGCTNPPTQIELPNTDLLDLSTVTLFKYENCDESTEIEFYRVNGGGHTWPGAFPVVILGPTNQDILASEVIWHFLRRFQHPDPAPGVILSNEEITTVDELISVGPNPFSDHFWVRNLQEDPLDISILDISGREVFNTISLDAFSDKTIDASGLPQGMLFLKVNSQDKVAVMKLVRY